MLGYCGHRARAANRFHDTDNPMIDWRRSHPSVSSADMESMLARVARALYLQGQFVATEHGAANLTS